MILKEYKSEYCKEITKLFYETVHTINAADYTKEQIDTWTNGIDLNKWNESLLSHYSLVAFKDEKIIGFGDIDSTGYLDRLYVHKDYQHQGVASAICAMLEKNVLQNITVHASITAKPFFEKRGYTVLKKQQVSRNGILLTNYIMLLNKNKIDLD